MQQTHKCSSDIKFRYAWGFLGAVCLIMVQDSVCHPPIYGDKSNMPDQKVGGQSSCWSIF